MVWVSFNAFPWFMITHPFVEQLSHSCKRNHSKMRNALWALTGGRKWHWTLAYKLKIPRFADMHLLRGKAIIILFYFFVSEFLAPSTCALSASCDHTVRGCVCMETNSRNGWALINESWWIRERTISAGTEGELLERYTAEIYNKTKQREAAQCPEKAFVLEGFMFFLF